MKRKVLAVLLAASMMGTLGACGSSDSGKQTDAKTDDSSSTETTDSGEASADSSDGSFDGVKIEVDIEDSIQGDQNTLDCFNKLIDEFSQQTGAEVEVVQNGSDHENIMKTRMASQDMPDMFVTHGWSTLRYNDFCEDLSGEEWVSRLDDAVKAVITDENGKVCTAPLTQWVYGMVYNADVLEANDIDPYAIKTWDDFKAACEKLEANGTTPLVISGKNGSTLTGTMEQLPKPLAAPALRVKSCLPVLLCPLTSGAYSLRLPLPHTGLNRFLCIPVPAARLPLSLRSEYR